MRMAAIWPPVAAVLPMPPLRVLARGIYIDIEQIKPDKAACRLRSVGFA
jgi:hypothetical protein